MSSDRPSRVQINDTAPSIAASKAVSPAVERVLDWHRQQEQRKAAARVEPIDAMPGGTAEAGN